MDISPLISIFIPSLRGGGVERVQLNLARRFVERGYRVDIVLAQYEGAYLSQVPKGVGVIDLKAARILTSLPALVRYIRNAQPVALLSAMDHCNIVALLANTLALANTRIVVSVHNIVSIRAKHSKLTGRLIPYLAHWIYSRADGVIAVSLGVADDLSKTIGLPREKIRVIYNPVVVPGIFESASEAVDHPWFRFGEPPVLLSAGRLTRQKDYSTLLHAFALVSNRRPMRLVILGEGEQREELEGMVRDLGLTESVSLPGFANNPYAYMSNAKLFVLSSVSEGFGNVLVEAMAVGTPVVSTDCPHGPAEVLDNGKYGRLVPVADAEALAEGILAEFDQSISSEVLQQRADEFSYDAIGDQYLEILRGNH